MNVLVTSASRKVGLIQAFQRAVAERAPDGRVIAVDIDRMSPALYMADERFLVPRSDDETFIPVLLELCRSREVSLVVPTRDEELPLFASYRSEFEKAGVLLAVSSVEAIETCQDKQAFISFCAAHGFAVPALRLPSAVGVGDLPLFVRPRRGKGGRGARIVRTLAELELALAEYPDAVLQEVCEDSEYTVDVFLDKANRTISAVPRERVFVLAGESYVGRTVKDWTLIWTASRLAEQLQLFGHVTIQCFYDGSSVRFIEVNPRYGGAANLGFAAGAFTPGFLIDIALGNTVEPALGEIQDGLVMLRFARDLFLDEEGLDVSPWE